MFNEVGPKKKKKVIRRWANTVRGKLMPSVGYPQLSLPLLVEEVEHDKLSDMFSCGPSTVYLSLWQQWRRCCCCCCWCWWCCCKPTPPTHVNAACVVNVRSAGFIWSHEIIVWISASDGGWLKKVEFLETTGCIIRTCCTDVYDVQRITSPAFTCKSYIAF